MKILCIPDGLPLDYTIQLANALAIKNEEVSILLMNNPQVEEHLKNIDKNVNCVLTRKIVYPIYNPKNLLMIINLISQIRQLNPDIVHVQGGDLLTILLLLFLKKNCLITTFHDVRIHPGNESLRLRFVRYYFKKYSNAIFVHGKKLKEIMADHYNIPEANVHVIPFGEHNTEPFEPYMDYKGHEENVILFFGWIGYHKGLEYLIRAESLIKKEVPDVKIIIAGQVGGGKYDQNYFEKCKEMISDKKNFELYPQYIYWEFGAELFNRSSVVILPYIETSQSGVVPVAYKFKKPVIATDVGALSDIVSHGKTGFIVPPKDTDALAKAVIKLLKDEKLREKMGEEGYRKLKTDFSWDKIAEKTINVYKKVLANEK